MITKEVYKKPEIEIIEIEINCVIADSFVKDMNTTETDKDGVAAYSRRRNFWKE